MAEYQSSTPEKPHSSSETIDTYNQTSVEEHPSHQIEQQFHQEREIQSEQARRHMAEMIEEQKTIQKLANDDTSDIDLAHIPKKEKSFTAWLEHLAPEDRVPVSKKLILSKGKKLVDVIHSFILLEDFSGLDSLEEELSESYDELVTHDILPDLRRRK